MKNNKTFRTILRLGLFLVIFGTIAWTQSGLLSIDPNFLSRGYVGEAYPNIQFTQCCSTQPVTWSLSAGSPPAGMNLSSAGVLTGTPTVAGNYAFTVRVSESPTVFLDQPMTLEIYQRPVITSASPLPAGEEQIPYSVQLTGTGGSPPYSFVEDVGAASLLPPGLNLSIDGLISGTPTQAGTFTFPIRIWDGQEVNSTKQLTIVVYPPPSITTGFLESGMTYTPYMQQLTVGGGRAPYTWSLVGNGTLPPGLTLNPTTGVISGTPAATGFYAFAVRVQDSLGGSSINDFLYIFVSQGFAVLTSTLPEGIINEPYTATLVSTPYDPFGSPGFALRTGARLRASAIRQAVISQAAEPLLHWSVYSGSLPPGLTLNPATGTISGIPTVLGSFNFSVIVQTNPALDISHVTSQPKPLVIAITDPPVDFTPAQLDPGFPGLPYTVTFKPKGGDGTYVFKFSTGELPPGLQFNAETRTISGTPAKEGTFSFTIDATSGGQYIRRSYSLVIEPAKLTVLPLTLPEGYQGTAYTAQLTAQLGKPPYTFSVASGALPAGVVLAADGAISGTPTTPGTTTVTLRVADADGVTSTREYSIQVYGTLTLGPAALPGVAVGQSYSGAMTATGGKPPYVFSIVSGTLPPGLQLIPSGGSLTGSPQQQGEFQFTGRVTDANEKFAERLFTLNVTGPLQLQPATLPVAPLLVSYAAAVTASGGAAPYSYSISGMLPPGVTFSSSGTFGGAPAAPGDYAVRIAATDAQNRSISRAYVISVPRGLTILPETLPSATAGAAFNATFSAVGGSAPYQWASEGSLPAGLSLNSGTGVLAGTPSTGGTFNFTVRAQDVSGLTGSRSYTVVVAVPPLPTLTFTELPETSPPGQQPRFGIKLSAPYPIPITGTVRMTFAPDQGADDPAVQFAAGGRTTSYTIPAGNDSGQFTGTPALQTGTVAGLITLVTTYTAGGQDVTPSPAPTDTLRVNAAAPVLTRIELVRNAGGFDVIVTGFSSTRQVTSGTVRFTGTPGANLQTEEVPVPLSSIFQTWYSDAGSAPYGSQFRLVIPFTISGETNAIAGASVQLTNNVGASNTISGNF